jgi:hypothetical protein
VFCIMGRDVIFKSEHRRSKRHPSHESHAQLTVHESLHCEVEHNQDDE